MSKVNRSKSAYVYWIHLASHADIATQGYVGVATESVRNRIRSHEWMASRDSQLPLHRAIRKYGMLHLRIDVVMAASAQECLRHERILRPTRNIGWNVAIGGEAPMLGGKLSDAHKAAVSKAQKGRLRTDAEKLKISEVQRGRVPSEQARRNMHKAAVLRVRTKGFSAAHCANISAAKKGVPSGLQPWEHNMADPEVWRQAASVYDDWQAGISGRQIDMSRGWPHTRSARMLKMFKTGWKPTEDKHFRKWLRATKDK